MSGVLARSRLDLLPLQPKPRSDVIETLLSHLHTDAACCREQNGAIAARQAEVGLLALHLLYFMGHRPVLVKKVSVLSLLQVYTPIVEAVSKRLEAGFSVSDSIFGSQQSHATVAAVHSYLEGDLNELRVVAENF